MGSNFKLIDLSNTVKNTKTEIDYSEFLNTILNASNRLLDVSDFKAAIFNSIEILDQSFIFSNINIYLFKNDYSQITKLVGSNNKTIKDPYNYTEKRIRFIYENLYTNKQVVFSLNNKQCLLLPIHFQNEILGFAEFTYDAKFNLSVNLITLLKIFVNSLSEVIIRNKREKEVENLSYYDTLTSLHNRRYFDKVVDRITSSKEYLPLSIIVADINGLKLVNDSFGHSQGDQIIKVAANIIKEEVKEDDILCRWGGDEFVIILPNSDESKANDLVDRINKKASQTTFNFIPISIAMATSTTHSLNFDISRMFKSAEDSMYKIKNVDSPIVKRQIVHSVLNALYSRSSHEEAHSKRVSQLCGQIALAMGYPEPSVNFMKQVGLYHDIGKISVKESTLNKPSKLDEEEYNELKRHCEVGYRILSSVIDLSELADYILKHHERLDGKGYPYGLVDDEIPQMSKILAVAEAFDAMCSNNNYHIPMPLDLAIKELIINSGTQFDASIVRVLVERVLKKQWYSVLFGVNNCFVELNEKFDPLNNVVVIDPNDIGLSVKDVKVDGYINTSIPGTYQLIYTIINKFGDIERVSRKITVGCLKKLDLFNNDELKKIEIDGSIFDYIYDDNSIRINIISGGGNNWSSQLIYPNVTLVKGKKYLVKFKASSSISRKEVHVNVGWVDEDNNFWHSFLNHAENKFYLETLEQEFVLLFNMEADTFPHSDFKFEFGTGENTRLNITNVRLYIVE